MHQAIQIRYEGKRGCGYRSKPGAMYLVADGESHPCGRLPIPLTTCPCCGHGFKPTRGWTWVDGDRLIEIAATLECHSNGCDHCIISRIIRNRGQELARQARAIQDAEIIDRMGKAGLLWIGEEFYATPADFTREAQDMGISRRISAVPHGFVVGETWVLLAHRKAIVEFEFGNPAKFTPGIFRLFKPTAIEIISDGKEPPEVIEDYLRRGLTPVMIQRTDTPVIQSIEALL